MMLTRLVETQALPKLPVVGLSLAAVGFHEHWLGLSRAALMLPFLLAPWAEKERFRAVIRELKGWKVDLGLFQGRSRRVVRR